jgi:membrane-bound serine protease (ClpP class)
MVLDHSHATSFSQRDRTDLVGRRGTTVTPLRPSGRVRFGTEEVDVITEGEYVDRDCAVEVTAVEGTRVVVRTPEVT